MALFKKRKGADEPMAAPSPTESIEVMRRRARHRLIGAVVLVLAGVIGFPILFDTQPRPVAVDIPITIPDRNKVKPLPLPAQAAAPSVVGKVTAQPPAAPVAPVPSTPVVETKPVESTSTEQKVAKSETVAEKTAEPKAAARPEPKAEAKAEDGAKARALLEGKAVDAGAGRFVVQVGAFSEKDKAQQAQQKLERAGLKNYTQVADTEEGKRIRVRAGPFASRAEADKAAEKIKGLDLPVRILTL